MIKPSQDLKKEFIKILEGIDRSKHRQDNFRNMCEMAYCALAKKTQPDEEKAEKLEARYMEIVGSYRNKDDVREMPKLLSLVTLALSGGGCDFLGEIAGEINALDTKNGQFFTPYDVSKFMAKLQIPNVSEIIKDKGYFTLSDPAAGAGCMILAAADVVQEQGFHPMDCMSVHAVELNRMTYHMLYVQLALRGIAAQIIHGNSLSLETFTGAYTPAAIYFLGKHGRLFDPAERQDESRPPKTLTPIINGEQLTLL
ncbi:MAG: N-6 DNA methylase [Alphaproteobacteria bacterium]|nr:N-6 DNA methylase [Alphaproteobacteria bacterium]